VTSNSDSIPPARPASPLEAADWAAGADPGRRSPAKRAAIARAAAGLFTGQGFTETSVDQIAAAAKVSKQTVYDHFGDKEQLFLAVITAVEEAVLGQFAAGVGLSAADPGDLRGELAALGADYLRAVLDPDVMALRRLVIGEVRRFPQLAKAWYEQGPGWLTARLADRFGQLGQRGALRVDDPELAAHHFCWLVLGMPQNMMLFGVASDFPEAEIQRLAAAAADVFLAAYHPDPGTSTETRHPGGL